MCETRHKLPISHDLSVDLSACKVDLYVMCAGSPAWSVEVSLWWLSASGTGSGMQGTANLVEVARRAGVKRFVLVSSIGADEPFFPLNLLFGVSCLPVALFS